MATNLHTRKGRGLERLFLLLIGVVMVLLFLQLRTVLERDFAEVPRRLSDGSMINLNDPGTDQRMKSLLTKEYYFEDGRDISLATSVIARQKTPGLYIDNIGELNKERYHVSAAQAWTEGGESYRRRVLVSRVLLGFSGEDSLRYESEQKAPPPYPAAPDAGMGRETFSGEVVNRDGDAVAGVLVRLQMILPRDSVYGNVSEVERMVKQETGGIRKWVAIGADGRQQLQSLAVFARTDASGTFSFRGLPQGKAFEVLPLQPGFQFGASKGVEALDGDPQVSFVQRPHTIRLFSTRDFNNLKKEKALIVRLPGEVDRWVWIILGVYLGAFLLLHLLLSTRFPQSDQLLLPVIMVLTGLSLITLLSLQDPLRDRFLARSTLYYFAGGMGVIALLLLFDLRKFTIDSGLYRLFYFRKHPKAANGWPWAVAGVVLLLLTILFGTGPEGSGVKVNLFGFQPSEIVKFCLLFFLAGFFTANEKFISEYTRWQRRWSFFSFSLLAIISAILLFLVMGDLGPAMVVCFTFIILFSFSRGDFAHMAGAVLLYIIALLFIDNVWIATGVAALATALSFLAVRKGMSESAVMALVVIAGFLLLDQVPFLDRLFPGPVQRLTDRKSIWQDNWNNEVFGGDQVANGIWAMSSGGITGQGVGEGFAKTIPEAHTDMILPSIGEEFGWAGIVSVFLLFLIYLHRSLLIGRQTGTPFLYYLCAGIGISTFMQFLLIAGGSTGVLPLSGVSLPFISYGGSSLLINCAAAGFLLSASGIRGSAAQMKYLTKQQDRNLMPALVAACVGILLLAVNVSRYLFRNEEWVVKPALVADRSGARMFSYNPRINILMNRLEAGNLYDRKGRLLATSKPEQVLQARDTLVRAGILPQQLQALTRKRLDRYYPFAEHMFFWTGDLNTGVFMGSINGYFAEYELL
ncbi:MAG TPA: FtsW/RodA/SpoVE family cell cycle protein, partial [Chitinophagaceae bacterium]|nr:FtsW/RodA/SpoVE family cell cycle protein [Chitinophagaceae bacterium]